MCRHFVSTFFTITLLTCLTNVAVFAVISVAEIRDINKHLTEHKIDIPQLMDIEKYLFTMFGLIILSFTFVVGVIFSFKNLVKHEKEKAAFYGNLQRPSF
jgi:ABC-type uncharacterized transport system permease subunit